MCRLKILHKRPLSELTFHKNMAKKPTSTCRNSWRSCRTENLESLIETVVFTPCSSSLLHHTIASHAPWALSLHNTHCRTSTFSPLWQLPCRHKGHCGLKHPCGDAHPKPCSILHNEFLSPPFCAATSWPQTQSPVIVLILGYINHSN